jgi:hypothetical protein
VLFLKYWPLGKEIGFKETYEIVVRAPHPLEQHRGVLHLLSHIMEEQLFQCVLLGIVGALAIPIDGVEFLLQGGDGANGSSAFLPKDARGERAGFRSTCFVPTGRYSHAML